MQKLKQILPTHNPPDAVWERIAEELSPLREVAAHHPPESVWENIEKDMGPVTARPDWQSGGESFGHTGLPMYNWRVAAGLLVPVLGFAIWFWMLKKPSETISYSEEKSAIQTPLADDEVEQQYARIQALCVQRVAACETPDFKNLKRELDDLTTASQQLRDAMGAYNTDEALTQQLSDIERERGLILRRLEQKI
jgi:hypothetical protein